MNDEQFAKCGEVSWGFGGGSMMDRGSERGGGRFWKCWGG